MYRDSEDLNVVVQDESYRLCEWIKIRKEQCSPNDNLCMVGIKVVRMRNTLKAVPETPPLNQEVLDMHGTTMTLILQHVIMVSRDALNDGVPSSMETI